MPKKTIQPEKCNVCKKHLRRKKNNKSGMCSSCGNVIRNKKNSLRYSRKNREKINKLARERYWRKKNEIRQMAGRNTGMQG